MRPRGLLSFVLVSVFLMCVHDSLGRPSADLEAPETGETSRETGNQVEDDGVEATDTTGGFTFSSILATLWVMLGTETDHLQVDNDGVDVKALTGGFTFFRCPR